LTLILFIGCSAVSVHLVCEQPISKGFFDMSEVKLTSLIGNSQKLDGGAMFGNAPKALWQRWSKPDEYNRIDLACRCLLVQTPTKNILFETGVGAFFAPDMKERFGVVESEHVLLDNLAAINLEASDIDVVVLSHLHFDHAGGLLTEWQEGVEPELAFDRATFVVGKTAWERALNPHMRDRASFIPLLQKLLQESGRLQLVDQSDAPNILGAGFRFHVSNGHTPGMLLTEIPTTLGPVLFSADLIPGAAWVHLPLTMGYDRYPELLIEEKQHLLMDLIARGGRLFFTHDPDVAMGTLYQNDKGRYGTNDNVPGFSAL
jgi:glyoxylase-like metal-dependent hydrolase (beta-lactamase superfamily II)